MKAVLLFKSLRKELRDTPEPLGFAAHWAWILGMFWSPLYYDVGTRVFSDTAHILLLEPLWLISLGSNVLTIGFLLTLSYFRNPLVSVRALFYLAAVFTGIGTLCVSSPVLSAVGDTAAIVYVVGSILTGCGSAVIVILWGEHLTSLGSRRTIIYLVVSFLIASTVYLVFIILPQHVCQIGIAFLPLASIASLRHSIQSAAPMKRVRKNEVVREKAPYAIIAISLFFGFSFGVMKGLFSPSEQEPVRLLYMLNIVAIVSASAAVYLTTSVCKMNFDRMTFQVVLPLIAAGFLFVPLHEPWNIIGTGIHQLGYQYFYIILWATWSVVAIRADIPSGWIVAWGMFSIQLGQLAGSVTSSYIASFLHTDFAYSMFAAVFIFAILLVALFAFGKNSPNTGWGFFRPIEEQEPVSLFDRSCNRLARRHQLSPRETEVFFLLARGRNRAHISEELVISDETVKSHIKNIYRKASINSQQQLIDMIENENE